MGSETLNYQAPREALFSRGVAPSPTFSRPQLTSKMANTTTVTIGSRSFDLDKTKAEAAFAAKRVINGRETMFFNLLPIKYQWAYDQYKIMKANHWEPEDVIMQKDIEQWRGSDLSDVERWIVKMAIGYFSAAEGIVGDNILHVVRQLVTAPELKLMLGRHAHEENIHADSLVYMISSLGINPHEPERAKSYKSLAPVNPVPPVTKIIGQ